MYCSCCGSMALCASIRALTSSASQGLRHSPAPFTIRTSIITATACTSFALLTNPCVNNKGNTTPTTSFTSSPGASSRLLNLPVSCVRLFARSIPASCTLSFKSSTALNAVTHTLSNLLPPSPAPSFSPIISLNVLPGSKFASPATAACLSLHFLLPAAFNRSSKITSRY